MIIRDTAVAIVVGMVLLRLLGGLIYRVQFSWNTVFWCSFIGRVFACIVAFFVGYLLYENLGIGLLITSAIGWVFVTI
jgi:membrane protein DedA with SNARE-associated domain